MSDALPLTVITGFLGSGKTTLIRALLADPRMAGTAVIVNEFGEVGLDHELIESSEEDLVELSTGCLCCASRGDLTRATRRLLERRDAGADIRRLVLETTGLADPAPILQSLLVDPLLRQAVTLARVVVTLDAITGTRTLNAHAVSRKQAALGDLLLLTKSDVAPAGADDLVRHLRRLNPHAPQHTAVLGDLDPALILEPPRRDPLPAAGPAHEGGPGHQVHDDISSVSLLRDEPLHAVTLTLLLQALADACGEDLLRIKGIVQVAQSPDTPAVVHGVQHVFHPVRWLARWPPGERRTRLVLIGRRLRSDWVHALLETIEGEVAGL